MRYRCGQCGQWIKDKFFFGLLHFCLTDDELAQKRRAEMTFRIQEYQQRGEQLSSEDFYRKILRGAP